MNSLVTGMGGEEVKKKPLPFSPIKSIKSLFEHRHENKSCSACPEDQLEPF